MTSLFSHLNSRNLSMKRIIQLCLIVFSLSLLTACAPNLSSGNYSGSQVGVASKTVTGTIISKRLVQIDNNSGMGGLLGAGAGAVAGSAIGGGTRANILGGIGGAVAGGLIGNAVDKGIHSQQGFEYIIRVSKGNTISVTQTTETNLAVGQKVMVIYGNPVRVIPE